MNNPSLRFLQYVQRSLLLTLFCFVLHSDAEEYLYVKLISLEVIAQGGICDIPSKCDLYLKICISSKTSRHECDVLYWITPREAHNNQDYVIYGQQIGDQPNPKITTVPAFPDVLNLKVDVFDADHTWISPDQHIVTLTQETFVPASQPSQIVLNKLNKSVAQLFEPQTFTMARTVPTGFVRLRIAVWIQCAHNSYGPRCENKCLLEHPQSGKHYGCMLSTGARICMPGWYGPQCDKVDICDASRPCGPTGVCKRVDDGFQCVCTQDFSDQICTQPRNPCQSHGSLSGGTPTDPYCRNRGLCVLDENRARKCICGPGFTGTRCEHDVDECSLWYSIQSSRTVNETSEGQTSGIKCYTPGHVASPCCGEKAVCQNKIGGYQCMCPTGWTGLHCEYPPTFWPSGFQPQVNVSVGYANVDFSLWSPKISEPVIPTADERSSNTGHPWAVAFGILFLILVLIVTGAIIFCVVQWRRRKKAELLHMRPLPRPVQHQPRRYVKPSALESGREGITNTLYTAQTLPPAPNSLYPTLSVRSSCNQIQKGFTESLPQDTMYEQLSDQHSEYDSLLLPDDSKNGNSDQLSAGRTPDAPKSHTMEKLMSPS